MEQVRLDKLLISEVSGVDDPANMLPGWMVTKSADGNGPDLLLVLADEMETLTKASDSKQPYGDVKYADPGYQKDGKKRYPLDTETHIRAAWSYINVPANGEAYTAEQLTSIKAKIKTAMKGLGAETESAATKTRSENIVATIKGNLLGTPTEQEGEDMDKDELVAAIVEGNEPLVKAVTDAVAKSLTPAEGEGATVTPAAVETPAAEDAPAFTEAQIGEVTKAVEALLAPYNEIFEKVLDRLEGTEKHLGIAARKSLDGQESGEGEGEPVVKATPDLGDAIAAALTRKS